MLVKTVRLGISMIFAVIIPRKAGILHRGGRYLMIQALETIIPLRNICKTWGAERKIFHYCPIFENRAYFFKIPWASGKLKHLVLPNFEESEINLGIRPVPSLSLPLLSFCPKPHPISFIFCTILRNFKKASIFVSKVLEKR